MAWLCLLGKDEPQHKAQLARRVPRSILGKTVYFISPEDLILNKLKWYEQSQSSRHLEDAESVVKISGGQLNYAYLKEWAEKLRISETLNQLLKSRE